MKQFVCVYVGYAGHHNASMIQRHEEDTAVLMRAVRAAVDRPPKTTMVIVMTGGRNFIKGVACLRIHVYVCMYVHMYLCTYVCVYLCTYVCIMYVCMYVFMYVMNIILIPGV